MNNVTPLRTVEPLRPRDYSAVQLDLIRRTVAKDCDRDEFDLFVEVARRVGLDPFRKQIHAVVYNKNKPDKRKMSIITGIDGFRAIADRTGTYRPDEQEPVITYDPALIDLKTNPLGIEKATVRLNKFGPDRVWYPVAGMAYWSEFAPITERWAEIDEKWRGTGEFFLDPKSNWYRMPRVMLPKCATAQACRAGWPDNFSGVYIDAEMDRVAAADITASAEVEQFEQEKRLKLVGATNAIPILWKMGDPIQYVPAGKLGDEAAKYIKDADMAAELKWWWETNTAGFREFWAISKSDGLGVKKLYEDRLKALEG